MVSFGDKHPLSEFQQNATEHLLRLKQSGRPEELTVDGQTGYQINTSTKGWDFMPFNGQKAPEAWPEERVKNALANLDIKGIFFNYKARGITLESMGKENAERHERDSG